jgi:hypothetical protein
VSDAEANQEVEVGLLPVEDHGLRDGAAHGLELADPDFLLIPTPIVSLGVRPTLQATDTTWKP